MAKVTTQKSRPIVSSDPLTTRARAVKRFEACKSEHKLLAGAKENAAPGNEAGHFVQFHPGDRVKVQARLGKVGAKRAVWVEGVIARFMGPLPMKADDQQTDLRRAILVPVRFRLRQRGPQIMQRFPVADIVLLEKSANSR